MSRTTRLAAAGNVYVLQPMSKRKAATQKGPAPKRRKVAGTKTFKPKNVVLAPELKYNDAAFAADATTTGAIVALNNMAAGDTALLRDGNKILMKTIQLRFTIENEANNQNNAVRMLIVYDKQPNLAAATIAGAGTGPLDTITIQSLRQVATTSRFKVLMDRVYVINSTSDTAGALQIMHDEAYIKIPSDCQLTQFADGAAGAPQTGNLLLMYFGNVAAGAADTNVLGQARLRFIG